MITDAEAPVYLWNLVRDLTLALRTSHLDEARSRIDEAMPALTEIVYAEHLTRAQVRGLEKVASLLHSGQTPLALELLEGELRNSFLVSPIEDTELCGDRAP